MSAVIQEAELVFRPMLEEDLLNVLEIEAAAYEFPWTRTIFRDCLRVGYSCWLLEFNGVAAGYGVMTVATGESHILNLCIDPQMQGGGLGRVMLDYMLETARKYNADTAFLEVRPSNHRARDMYLAGGFAQVGVRRDYYPARDGREDAIIMAKRLV